jgi:hypothetical protein
LQNRGETIYGSAFALEKDKAQQINDLLRSSPHRNKIKLCQQPETAFFCRFFIFAEPVIAAFG